MWVPNLVKCNKFQLNQVKLTLRLRLARWPPKYVGESVSQCLSFLLSFEGVVDRHLLTSWTSSGRRRLSTHRGTLIGHLESFQSDFPGIYDFQLSIDQKSSTNIDQFKRLFIHWQLCVNLLLQNLQYLIERWDIWGCRNFRPQQYRMNQW